MPTTNVSESGIKFIAQWEGTERKGKQKRYAPKGANLAAEDSSKYYYYMDPINLPTIGIGHLLTTTEKATGMININGKNVDYRNGLTLAQVHELKMQDVKRFVDAVNKYIKVPLTQNQFDALVSWSLNVGAGRLDPKVTTLARKLNAGDYAGAADQFLVWNKAGGRVLTGLTNRRKAERELFLRK